MAKRKLTNRQKTHIARIQEKRRIKHASKDGDDLPNTDDDAPLQGRVITRHGQNLVVRTEENELKHCLFRQNIGHLVCGDYVLWQKSHDTTGVVTAILPRKTVLSRPDYNGHDKAIAANISLLVVVLTSKPAPSGYLLDQYLIAGQLNNIQVLIALNKADLLSPDEYDEFYQQFAIYPEIGYQVLPVSAKMEHGLDPLIDQLKSHTSILVGQSGVGKSSLINALIPNQQTQVGRLSSTSKQHGRHTTSATTLYRLPTGGEIIDSPGVRSFRLGKLTRAQLENGFSEFHPYIGRCKFSNCLHRSEPGCAITDAVLEGKISQQRLDIFLNMAEDLL